MPTGSGSERKFEEAIPGVPAQMPSPGAALDVHLLLEIVDSLDAMIAYWDEHQVCRFANQAYVEWFGRGRQDLLGRTLQDLLGPLYELNLPHIRAAYAGQRQVFERAIPAPGGEVRHSLATYVPRLVDGRVVGIFVHVADVGPLKRLQAELQAAKDRAESVAFHDPLTGLPNRVLLQVRIEDAFARAKRNGEPVYMLSIDVDNFKSINDTHGHMAGDRILIEIAARIASCAREYDTVTRLGGDEFIVLATGMASDEEAQALARRMLDAASRPLKLRDACVTPSLSIGIAAYPRDAGTPEALMEVSDRALYAAKTAGRQRFAMAAHVDPA